MSLEERLWRTLIRWVQMRFLAPFPLRCCHLPCALVPLQSKHTLVMLSPLLACTKDFYSILLGRATAIVGDKLQRFVKSRLLRPTCGGDRNILHLTLQAEPFS